MGDKTGDPLLATPFCQYVISGDKPLVVSNANKHPKVQNNQAIQDLNVIAYLGIPVRCPAGNAIGSLCAIESSPRDWTNTDIEVLKDLVELVETEIELQLHARNLQFMNKHLEALVNQKNQRTLAGKQ